MDLSNSELIKKEYGHLSEGYFNSAYLGPSPMSAKETVNAVLDREVDPRNCLDYDEMFFGLPDRIRKQISSLLGCEPRSISLNTSCADIISAIAHGLKLSPTDVIVSFSGEFPSNVIPWMVAEKNRGLNFHVLDHPLPTADWLRENLPKNTKVLNISHVAFDTGRKIDIIEIGKLAKERDILFILDTTQSLGGLGLSPEELATIDIMTCSTYKWMLGPYGAAFSYFNDKALDMIVHQTGNWITSPNSKGGASLSNYTIETLDGARKFDRGQSPNMLINAALSSSFDLLINLGLKEIGQHNRMLSDYFLEIIPKDKFEIKTPLEFRGNILALSALKTDSDTLDKNLKKQRIEAGIREGNIRLSFHLFNTKSQVESLVKALDI